MFDDKHPEEGRYLLSLLQGSMRALTGLIGQANHRNVGYSTPTATIGIRGTGLDLECAGDACSFFTWLGTIEVTQHGHTEIRLLPAGQGLHVTHTGTRTLSEPTLQHLKRPDTVPINLHQLFSVGGVSAADEGLFVFVRDGHIEVTTAKETLHMGRGETGFAGGDGRTGRPVQMPLFILYDKVPLPNSVNPLRLSVLSDLSKSTNNQCR